MPVDRPGQVGRHVIVDYSAALYKSVVAGIQGPEVFIEVCQPREAVAPYVPAGWAVRDRAYLMSRALGDEVGNNLEGFEISIEESDERIEAIAKDAGGALAARGVCGLVGDAAVFDQIVTDEAFRRRGLGRAIMGALGVSAVAHGATEGVLIATADGRALYRVLGWTEVSEVTSVISA